MTTQPIVPTIVADLPPIKVPPALAYAADRLLADLAVDPARLLRAAALMDDCERLADGRWICPASDGKHAYHITAGLCNCPDAAARDARRCKHALAVQLHCLMERYEAEALDPTPPPMAGGAEDADWQAQAPQGAPTRTDEPIRLELTARGLLAVLLPGAAVKPLGVRRG